MSQSENGLIRALVIVLVASVAIVPTVFYGCSPEWARWDAAQAYAFFREGEVDDALYQLRDAVKKNPRDPVLKTTLAERLIEIDQAAEAISLAEEVLEAYPDNTKAMEIKSMAQKSLGQFEASLETELEIDSHLHAYRRNESSLNQLAYARALAGKDLNLAKKDIETAVAKMNRQLYWNGSDGLTAEVRAIVLAAMVSRNCDATEDAIQLISTQIERYLEQIDSVTSSLTFYVYRETERSFPIRQNATLKNLRSKLRLYETNAAALLSCRAILYHDQGKPELCIEDRMETKQLGYDSEEILASIPGDKRALELTSYASALLDTRGYICSLLPWSDDLDGLSRKQQSFYSSYDNAIRDMNIAVFCSEINCKAVDTPLMHNLDTFDAKQRKEDLEKQLAVLLYHRQTLLERRGEEDLALKDKERIRKLGFESNDKLY